MSDIDISKTKVCAMPWMNLGTETNGKCKICCVVMTDQYIKKPGGEDFLIQKDAIQDIFDSEYLRDVRKKMLRNEWPLDCKYCEKQEDVGQYSPRLEYNEKWLSDDVKSLVAKSAEEDGRTGAVPISFEPRPGTTCNLKCATCWSLSSSAVWAERKAALDGRFGEMPVFLRESWQRELGLAAESDFGWSNDPIYMDNFRACIPTLKRLYFTGGEPTLIRSIRVMLRELLDAGRTDLYVSMTSNLTHVDPELIDLASRFERFEFTGSIDGFGASNEYIRFPTDWSVVEKNLRFLCERGISVTIMSVVQIANVSALAELQQWMARDRDFAKIRILPTVLQAPGYLRATLLPDHLKKRELARLKNAIDDEQILEENRARLRQVSEQVSVTDLDAEEMREQFRQFTDYMDRARGTRFRETFPHLVDLLREPERIGRWNSLPLAQGDVQGDTQNETWKPFCLAPWVHTYMHPSAERRLCCVSDDLPTKHTEALPDYWNGDYMRDVRQKMVRGAPPPECDYCRIYPNPYKNHFDTLYDEWRPLLKAATAPDGRVEQAPVSFDYRLGNLCNFKCFMCGSDYSSAWQQEMIDRGHADHLPTWLHEPRYSEIKQQHKDVSERDLYSAIESRAVREIYWAGGEPLFSPVHWEAMDRIIANGHASQMFIRYNTNFSLLRYRGRHLFHDILKHFPRYEISASLDGTGAIGEYLRTGLRWPVWLNNLKEAVPYLDHKMKSLHIENRLTTPGLFDLKALAELQKNYGVPVRSKVMNTPHPTMRILPISPLAFPRPLLTRLVDETLAEISKYECEGMRSIFRELEFLATCETFPDLYPRDFESSFRMGIAETLELEKWRIHDQHAPKLYDILGTKPYLIEWIKKFV